MSVNSSASGKLGTDTNAAHGPVSIAECLLHANHERAPVADNRDDKTKNKKYFPTVLCELGWKLHAKLTIYIFFVAQPVFNAGAGVIVVFLVKQMESVMRKSF